MFESCSSNVTLLFYQNRTPPWIFSEEYSDYFRDLYLSSEPNNYCFDTAAQGQLPKCKERYTLTALKTLIKSFTKIIHQRLL